MWPIVFSCVLSAVRILLFGFTTTPVLTSLCSGGAERGLDIVLHRLTLESSPALSTFIKPRLHFPTFSFDMARHAPAGLAEGWTRCTVPPPLPSLPEFRFLSQSESV